MYWNIFRIVFSGHIVSPSHVKAVLTEVKSLKNVCKEMDYFDSDNAADSDDFVDKVTIFWVNKNHKWYQLKTILMKCNEREATCHVEWLETYNRKGNSINSEY